jgi:hypothetical protein
MTWLVKQILSFLLHIPTFGFGFTRVSWTNIHFTKLERPAKRELERRVIHNILPRRER